MNTHTHLRLIVSVLTVTGALAAKPQGFIYDQSSSDEAHVLEGGSDITQNQPMGQSFRPTLRNVGFVRLYLYNGLLGDTSAATVHVNLRADSITGPLLAASFPVTIPGGASFAGPLNFFFENSPTVTPGMAYFFQPIVEDNDNIGLSHSWYNYSGGIGFLRGVPDPLDRELWFREGIVVPEPSVAAMLLIGILIVLLWSRFQATVQGGVQRLRSASRRR